MRVTSLLRHLLAMKYTRVVGAEFGPAGLQVDVAPTTRLPRCSGCGRARRSVYDRRSRTWRHLDFGGMEVTLRYDLRRVDCGRCGKVAELVPWAEHDSRYTRDFEDHVAYLAQRSDQTTVSTTMRIAWRTVGSIIERVVARCRREDLLDDLEYVGVDELSYRRHHEYLTVVVDHVKQRVVWACEGKNAATLGRFFDALGPERTAKIKCVTIDMSAAYIEAVRTRAPQAQVVFDRFHVQRLVQDALDEVRRAEVRALEGTEERQGLKKTRWALLKNHWNLSAIEHQRLSTVQRTNRRLYRAYLLKTVLADILGRRQVNVVRDKLNEWISWARRSRLKPFKRAAATIRKYFEGVVAIVETGLNNGRTEGLNGKIRTITRRAYGFHSAQSLIGFIKLCCTGLVLHPVFKTPPLHP
jgi:transposase